MASVTAVVVNYNYGAFVSDCLDSIDRQDHDDLRVLVIDDASTDDSRDIIDTWAATTRRDVVVVHKPRNRGPAHSYNMALRLIRESPTDFVAFIDSDDTWEPTKTSRQVARFDASPGSTVVVWSDTGRNTGPGTDRVDRARPAPGTGSDRTTHILRHGSPFALNGTLLRWSAVSRIRPFDESLRLCDLPLWLQMSRQGEFVHEPMLAGMIRVHPGSMSRTDLSADRLRILAANTQTRAERVAARERGHDALARLLRSPVRPPAGAYVAYARATRDPWTIPFAVRLALPSAAVPHLIRLRGRLPARTPSRQD